MQKKLNKKTSIQLATLVVALVVGGEIGNWLAKSVGEMAVDRGIAIPIVLGIGVLVIIGAAMLCIALLYGLRRAYLQRIKEKYPKVPSRDREAYESYVVAQNITHGSRVIDLVPTQTKTDLVRRKRYLRNEIWHAKQRDLAHLIAWSKRWWRPSGAEESDGITLSVRESIELIATDRQFASLRGAFLAWLVLTSTTFFGGFILYQSSQAATTFTVDTTANGADFDTGDGVCDTDDSVGDGPCTLHAAIQQANVSVGTDTIEFSITGAGPHTITHPSGGLPEITDPVIIDGTSEPDYVDGTPVVELDANSEVDVLAISSGSSTVRGLILNGSSTAGVRLSTLGGNTIQGNWIGVDNTGESNSSTATGGQVRIESGDANTIGGTTLAQRNIISGPSNGTGIYLTGGVTDTIIQGNYIGTDKDGEASIPNIHGIFILNAQDTTIGGATAAHGNVISGNGTYGIYNAFNNPGSLTINHNYIGVDATGENDLGNGQYGIFDGVAGTGGSFNYNVISGNDYQSARFTQSSFEVKGNKIGTDKDGMTSIKNAGGAWPSPVRYLQISGNNITVGGTTAAERNISVDGIVVSGTGTQTVKGNYFGIDATGQTALADTYYCLSITGTSVTVGGSEAGAPNFVGGCNNGDGIAVTGTSSAEVKGNIVGFDVDGVDAIPLGSNRDCLDISAPGAAIGGTTTAERNIVGNCGGYGINRGGTNATIYNNYIGVAADGVTAAPIGTSGIQPSQGAQIGGVASGQANIIANAKVAGIERYNEGVTIRGNSIFGNVSTPSLYGDGLGIDTYGDGVTANDADDDDKTSDGPYMQNFPVLTSASPGSTKVSGTLNSEPSKTYTLDFYSNTSCDASGNGEGKTYLGSDTVTTDAGGDGSFSSTLSVSSSAGEQVTATATDPDGNTSEFSACVEVTSADLSTSVTSSTSSPTVGTSFTVTITVTNNGPSTSPSSSATVTVPSNITVNSTTPSKGSYSSPTWTIGSMTNGESATLTMNLTATSSGSKTLTATASSSIDSNSANDQGSSTFAPAAEEPDPAPEDPQEPGLTGRCASGCIVTVPGPHARQNKVGFPPVVKVFDKNGSEVPEFGNFKAFADNYTGGGYIATGDIDGDGADEIVIGEGDGRDPANTGPGQRIKVFEADGRQRGIEIFPFSSSYDGGISVDIGDADGDGKEQEIIACQTRERSWCKVYKYNNARTVLAEWRAFDDLPVGALAAFADVDGDGVDEAVIGGGYGGGPHVRVFEINSNTTTPTRKPISFFAFHPASRAGVFVDGGDINGDGKDEISASQFNDQQEGFAKVYYYNNRRDIATEFRAFARYAGTGANNRLKDITGDNTLDLITAADHNGGPHIRTWNPLTGQTLFPDFFAYDVNFRGGVRFDVGEF